MKKSLLAIITTLSLSSNLIAQESFDFKYTNTSKTAAGIMGAGVLSIGGAMLYVRYNRGNYAALHGLGTAIVGAGTTLVGGIVASVATYRGLKKVDKESMANEYQNFKVNIFAHVATKGATPLADQVTLTLKSFDCEACSSELEKVTELLRVNKVIEVLAKKIAPKFSLRSVSKDTDLLEDENVEGQIEKALGENNTEKNRQLAARLLALNISFLKNIQK